MRYCHALPTIAASLSFALSASAAPPATQPATPPAANADNDAIAHAIADANGLEGWHKIERLDFTFNVDAPNRDKPLARQWSWWPKQGKMKLHGDGDEVQVPLAPGSMNLLDNARYTQRATRAHKQFINDTYWLLFPFQIVWSNPTVTDQGKAPLTMGGDVARKVTVQYPNEGGYTPGDAYDLFIDPDTHLIEAWEFRRGGKANGKRMTWEKHRRLGPIVVSLEHWGSDKQFHLWFSDVRATLTGRDAPVPPQPMER